MRPCSRLKTSLEYGIRTIESTIRIRRVIVDGNHVHVRIDRIPRPIAREHTLNVWKQTDVAELLLDYCAVFHYNQKLDTPG